MCRIRIRVLPCAFCCYALAGQSPAIGAERGSRLAEPNTRHLTPFLSGSFGTSQDLGGSVGLGVAVGYDLTRNLGIRGGNRACLRRPRGRRQP